ncbi:MAG: hypothetical protein HY690_16865 [Chloroflexi bacterium]|nr:hypothetical protein [Chloroflexota bacterium]
MVAIARNWREAGLDPQDTAILEFAEKLTLDPAGVEEADVERLRQVGFDDGQILDIVLAASYRNFINRAMSGLGVEFHDFEIDPRLAEAVRERIKR